MYKCTCIHVFMDTELLNDVHHLKINVGIKKKFVPEYVFHFSPPAPDRHYVVSFLMESKVLVQL